MTSGVVWCYHVLCVPGVLRPQDPPSPFARPSDAMPTSRESNGPAGKQAINGCSESLGRREPNNAP